MALGSVADFATELHGQTVAELVKYRLNASEPRLAMPPAGYGRLRADELVTINGWLERGAPAGTDVCSSGPPDSAVPPADGSPALAATPDGDLVCYPLLAHAGDGDTPYPVGVATDALVTFTFAAPWSTTAYAVLFRPVIDSVKSVHHWLLYQDDVPGTPGAIATSSGAHSDAQLVAAWAPGTDPLDFRKTGVDVGLELPHNKTYTLELHYNSSDPAARDRSGVEVCTHPRKPEHTASYSWLGSENFLFPADKWVGTCKPSNAEPIHILAIMPHMHYTGTHMKATLNRADGTRHVFHDSPFNFYYERLYLQQFTLEPGDSITTECTYSEPSTFGPGVDAEMCYLFTVAYPSGALVSPDLLGGFIHGGTACIGE